MQDPADTIPARAAELAVLYPALGRALARDSSPGTGLHAVLPAGVVNADVLHAMLTLTAEIPAARDTACDLIAERRQPRPVLACLAALPRLAARLHDLGQPAAEHRIAGSLDRWTQFTKTALGLRKPATPLGWPCPLHPEPAMLCAAGAEGFLREARDGTLTVEWHLGGVISCPQCEATWTPGQWAHLGRLLTASRSSPTPAPSRT